MNDAPPQPRLRISVLLAGGLLLVGLGAALLYGPGLMPLPELPTLPDATPAPDVVQLPEEFSRPVPRPAVAAPAEAPIIVQRPEPPPDPAPAPTPPVARQGLLDSLNPFAGLPTPPARNQPAAVPAPATQPQADPRLPLPQPIAQSTIAPEAATKPRKGWDVLAKGTHRDRAETAPVPREGKESTAPRQGAQDLIRPARWAMPAYPLKTLYRSMLLPGRLLDNVNSDIPGSTIRILTTVPVFDKFNYGQVILDKGSIIIAKQAGRTEFGQQRLPLRIEQIELVHGPVVSIEATVSDAYGAAGLPGKVNNHYGKLALATGINAVLNIGLASAVGTPGRGQFYQNPAQQAVQDAGQSVAQDLNDITRRQLKVPPTIEAKAGKIVTVSLEENIQFNRPPSVAR